MRTGDLRRSHGIGGAEGTLRLLKQRDAANHNALWHDERARLGSDFKPCSVKQEIEHCCFV